MLQPKVHLVHYGLSVADWLKNMSHPVLSQAHILNLKENPAEKIILDHWDFPDRFMLFRAGFVLFQLEDHQQRWPASASG